MEATANITEYLSDGRYSNERRLDRVYPLVYRQLRGMADRQLRRMSSLDTLCPTALVNEAFLKLVNGTSIKWQDRNHFLAVSATAMRHILINYAQAKKANKRGGDWCRVTYDEARVGRASRSQTLLALEESLCRLEAEEPRMAKVVELRFFGGLTDSEIATVLDVNERTVRRDWSKAKALLSLSLQSPAAGSA